MKRTGFKRKSSSVRKTAEQLDKRRDASDTVLPCCSLELVFPDALSGFLNMIKIIRGSNLRGRNSRYLDRNPLLQSKVQPTP